MNRTLLFLPHYNDEKGLLQSLESVPPCSEADVLIIDDGSVHKFDEEKIRKLLRNKAIACEIIYNAHNMGVTITKNKGLDYARLHNYTYIAFLDCCDTIHPNRLKHQIRFLDENPECMIVGSYVHFVNEKGEKVFDLRVPVSWEELKNKMYFNSLLIQPAVMLRMKVLEYIPYFPSNYDAAEDYAMFMPISQKYQVNNLPEFLTTTYINLKGLSSANRKKQVTSRIRIILKHFKWGYYPIMGLLRSCILLFVPFHITAYIKGIVYPDER